MSEPSSEPVHIASSPVQLFQALHYFDVVTSTNAVAKPLAEKNRFNQVVVAQEQKQGRGRFNRSWQSSPGGLYTSLILHVESSSYVTLFPLLTSIAVVNTLQQLNINASVKWPNDVQVHGEKIAGILLETVQSKSSHQSLIIGIGINANQRKKELPSDKPATSLKIHLQKTLDLDELLHMFLEEFEQMYQLFATLQYKRIIDLWKQHTDTLGKSVTITTQHQETTGTAMDITEHGFLQVKTSDGKVVTLHSGDCFYLES